MTPHDLAGDRPGTEAGSDRTASAFAGFTITGVIDGDTVEARWIPPVGLVCSPAWRRRAEVVVALGDTFDAGHTSPSIAATLDDDPTAVALTLLRALDRVTSVRLPPMPHGPYGAG
ncbi:MAG TPA: hypothetical protein VKA65_03645 [Acidimicrobiales bacterium]|nr:hypothetical protein [Acidimicrobiales bacterium]